MGISGARPKRIATQYGIASGGTESDITVSGVSYKLHTFTSDGNFVVSTGGWFDVLLVGGGNAGYAWAGGAGYAGGGGGAGGVFQQTIYLQPATHSVDVGAGASGVAGNIRGTQGFPSVIGTGINAVSAAGGITYFPDNGATGTVGGEIGSSGGCHNSASSSATNNVQGNKGGASTGINNGGGGGGFGAVGSAGSSTTGGAGGAGYDVSTFIGAGSSLFKAAGGGGGGSGAGGAGGSSIGGAGVTSGTGTAAAANTGSGGGGSTNTGTGGAGGSGIVYIRRRIEGDALATTQGYGVATGGTLSSITVGGVSYNLLTFTSDGTLTVTTAGLFDCLVLGGGGGGGRDSGGFARACGGGAGGVLQSTIYLTAGTTSITVGAGGVGGVSDLKNGTRGGSSFVGTQIYAIGGGGGSFAKSDAAGNGEASTQMDGASAGGGRGDLSNTGTLIATGQGNLGGAGLNAGGGGFGGVGATGTDSVGGAGGAGYNVSAFIAGSSLFKAAGGGGCGSSTGGAGGSSVGGTGGQGNANAVSAAANTASGGGGAKSGYTAGAGGSGIVYVRFRTA